jgi:predicted amidohydrolase
MLICYDRRFPEAYRCLALGGAEVIAIGFNEEGEPDATPVGASERDPSEIAMRAGAHANGVYVIAAGKVGSEGDLHFIGGSLVIGPTGDALARARGAGDELVLAEIDLCAARRLRERLDLATNRRPDAYGVLVRAPVPA